MTLYPVRVRYDVYRAASSWATENCPSFRDTRYVARFYYDLFFEDAADATFFALRWV